MSKEAKLLLHSGNYLEVAEEEENPGQFELYAGNGERMLLVGRGLSFQEINEALNMLSAMDVMACALGFSNAVMEEKGSVAARKAYSEIFEDGLEAMRLKFEMLNETLQ